MYKSQKERTFQAVRRTTKKQYNINAQKRNMAKIDYLDYLVNNDSVVLNKGE